MSEQVDLAVLMPSLPVGGVGRMRTYLMNGIVGHGLRVDLLIADRDSPYLSLLDPAIRLISVPTTHAWFGVPTLAWYLWRCQPRVLLTQRIRVNMLALRAQALARQRTRLVATVNVNMSSKLAGHEAAKQAREVARFRRYMPRFDRILAVSQGVASNTAALMGVPTAHIRVVPNPTVVPELPALTTAPLDHPWFFPGQPPVILGVGRLMKQKDFSMLLRAFQRLRCERPCRLMILGEGPLRQELEQLATQLGVTEDVELPGFVINPYQYMARAALFALSSRFEGSPNALTEALAIGTPLVATDCPDGPREILEAGRHGALVPVGDDVAFAAAMAATLDAPPKRAQLQAAAQRYTVERSTNAYLEAMGLKN